MAGLCPKLGATEQTPACCQGPGPGFVCLFCLSVLSLLVGSFIPHPSLNPHKRAVEHEVRPCRAEPLLSPHGSERKPRCQLRGSKPGLAISQLGDFGSVTETSLASV